MTAITINDLNNAKRDVDHIAEIATSTAKTATDRLGHTKHTMQGAIESIAAINVRGPWAPDSEYVVKDLVSESGTWHICVVAHTSGATFDADKWRVYQGIAAIDLAAPTGASMVGWMQNGNGAVWRGVEEKLRETISPADFGAIGDGITPDAPAYAMFEAAVTSAHLPDNSVFNLGSTKPVKLVNGPGKIKLQGSSAAPVVGGFEVLFDVAGGSIYATPDVWAVLANSLSSAPGGISSYFNVVLAPGSNAQAPDAQIWRSTILGQSAGERIVEWERSEAVGSGAMRFAQRVQRTTAIGSLSYQWLGAPSQQYLRDTFHDFWRSTVGSPGTPPWNFYGMETRNPGIGAKIDAWNNYPTATVTQRQNVGLGRDAGLHLIRGTRNTLAGYKAGANFFDSDSNAGLGVFALRDGVFINRNVGVGAAAGYHLQEGLGNVFVGYRAGNDLIRGDRNVVLGYFAGASAESDIGEDEDDPSAAALTYSDRLLIQNAAGRAPLIVGDFLNQRVGINCYDYTLLDTLPDTGLHVVGDLYLRSFGSNLAAKSRHLRFQLMTSAIEVDQNYGGLEWEGADNQAPGLRGYVRGVSVNTVGALAIDFGTQASSVVDPPVRRLRIGHDGNVLHYVGGTAGTTVIDANSHLGLRAYTVATLPSAAAAGRMIYVSNGATNKRLAVSDGAAWRFPDGSIVS